MFRDFVPLALRSRVCRQVIRIIHPILDAVSMWLRQVLKLKGEDKGREVFRFNNMYVKDNVSVYIEIVDLILSKSITSSNSMPTSA